VLDENGVVVVLHVVSLFRGVVHVEGCFGQYIVDSYRSGADRFYD
jgi:hypothetical protein